MTSLASLSTRTEHVGTLYFVALLREELGRRIATARKAAGMSQQELAAAIKLKHSQDISRYERGKVEVPAARIDMIAEATGRPRSYFTRDPAEPEVPTSPSPDDARLERLEDAVESLRQDLHSFLERLSERQAAP